MKLLVVVVLVCVVSGISSLPTRLTEEQFLSSTSEADSKSVDIVSGYAQIRRQGRNFGSSGEKLKFTRPVTVKDPAQFDPPTEAKRVTFDDSKSPVFSLETMIKEEAEKLKNEVEIASLMAAHAAENAAAHIKAAAEEAVQGGKIAAADVDKIIENAVNSGIREAEEIVRSEDEAIKEIDIKDVEDVKEAEDIKEVVKPEVEDIKEVESESSTEKVEKMLTEKVEESTSEKPTNVEWASDDQESVTEHVEVKEAVTEAVVVEEPKAEESNKIDEAEVEVRATEKVEEVVVTTQASNEDSKSDVAADESDESLRAQTTETVHPPQDVDLGSVQEV